MESNGYIVAAYVLTWVVLVGYAIRLHAVSRRSRQQYADAVREREEGIRD